MISVKFLFFLKAEFKVNTLTEKKPLPDKIIINVQTLYTRHNINFTFEMRNKNTNDISSFVNEAANVNRNWSSK